jgi:hypothetical protein
VIAAAQTVADLWHFLSVRKRHWLIPVVLGLSVVGALVVWLGSTAAGPFVYTLF